MNKCTFYFVFFLFFTAPIFGGADDTNKKNTEVEVEKVEASEATRLKSLLSRKIKEIFNGFEWHIEFPNVSFSQGGSDVQLSSMSPAWVAYYLTVGKQFLRYDSLRKSKIPGYLDQMYFSFANITDAYNDQRIAAMQKKFRGILEEKKSSFAKTLRIIVGTTNSPFCAWSQLLKGVIFCSRELWYSDPELAEIIMLHELGHLMDPVFCDWFAELDALVPAMLTAVVGFGLLQIMHHKAVRGFVKNPVASSMVGAWILSAEAMLFQKGFLRYNAELYADTFAAERIADPRIIKKLIDYIELVRETNDSWQFKVPFLEGFLRRFSQGYPSNYKRRKNLEDIMNRRLKDVQEKSDQIVMLKESV